MRKQVNYVFGLAKLLTWDTCNNVTCIIQEFFFKYRRKSDRSNIIHFSYKREGNIVRKCLFVFNNERSYHHCVRSNTT